MATKDAEKQRRLAEALRANLRKRKAGKEPGRDGVVAPGEAVED